MKRPTAIATRSRLPASFVAFDVLQANHQDVRSRPYDERQLLEALLEGLRPPIQIVPQTTDVD